MISLLRHRVTENNGFAEQDHQQQLSIEFHYISYSIFTLGILVSVFSLTPSWFPAPTLTHHHPHSPPWLFSCIFIPRGEELSLVITQVSVKWIIGRLIELHDGKHPSWVVWQSVLSPLPHASADAQGWHECILNNTAEKSEVRSATATCCQSQSKSLQTPGLSCFFLFCSLASKDIFNVFASVWPI